jgi:hypothetical protein
MSELELEWGKTPEEWIAEKGWQLINKYNEHSSTYYKITHPKLPGDTFTISDRYDYFYKGPMVQ